MENNAEKPRIIKKYPNRRLYDTCDSRYITMLDLRQLINDGAEFVVLDTKNGDDITRSILLQIIAEQENQGDPVFTSDFLMQLIRGYGNSMQSFFGDYLQESAKIFSEQQKQMQQTMGQVPVNPMEFMNKLSEQQMQMWKNWQGNLNNTNNKDDQGNNS